jgi:hypothetical protein
MRPAARFAVLACFAVLLAATLACSTLFMGDNERFIQGTWTHGTDSGDGHGTYLELTFLPGGFKMQGYPPLEQTGAYRVLSSAGDTLTLRLTGQAGDLPTDDRDMVIVLDRAAHSLTIDGGGPYSRSGP